MSNNKILIADSGATKTDWCLMQQGVIIHQFNTKGISPVFQTEDEITEEIKELAESLNSVIEIINFSIFTSSYLHLVWKQGI